MNYQSTFTSEVAAKIYIQSTYGADNTYVSDRYVPDVGSTSIGVYVDNVRILFWLTNKTNSSGAIIFQKGFANEC